MAQGSGADLAQFASCQPHATLLNASPRECFFKERDGALRHPPGPVMHRHAIFRK